MSDSIIWVEVGAALVALIGGGAMALTTILKRHKKKKKVRNQVEFEKIHTQVHEILTELRLNHDSARTSIVQFHNGGKYYNGTGMQRFSTTHESIAMGVSSTINNQQDVLLTRYTEMLKHVAKDDAHLIMVGEMPESNFKRYLDYNHVLAFSMIPIKDEMDTLTIGYLSSEWCSWSKTDDIDEEKIKSDIINARRLISVMLSHKHDKNEA
tara:strand:- start:1406 stop:2035 length:630 start_codon:yes stop_codon:yes gene_type:complete